MTQPCNKRSTTSTSQVRRLMCSVSPILSSCLSIFHVLPAHRHMCEFTGLDFEMEIKQHYHEVLAVLGDLLVFIFDQINANCKAELQTVSQQYPFKPLRYNKETLILPFPNAISMLQQAGEEIGPEDDFTSGQNTHNHRRVVRRHTACGRCSATQYHNQSRHCSHPLCLIDNSHRCVSQYSSGEAFGSPG